MKFTVGKLIEDLQAMVRVDPEIKKYLIITSIDNKGSKYKKVNFPPVIGEFHNGKFTIHLHPQQIHRNTSVCIN